MPEAERSAPPDVVAAAAARAAARESRDWARADELRVDIEAAGWKVTDSGTSWTLEPAVPADVEVGSGMRYGSEASVPSRLDLPPTRPATLVIVAEDVTGAISRTLDGIRAHDAGAQVVVVANGPAPELEAELASLPADGPSDDPDMEVLRTSARLPPGVALSSAVRRASGAVVVLLRAGIVLDGEVSAPLVAALADPEVAVAGAFGLRWVDGKRFEPAAGPRVDAIDDICLAFRRDDLLSHGPLDGGLRRWTGLATWWSLCLRDGRHAAAVGRSALVLPLPVHVQDLEPADAWDRDVRRDGYRIADRFRGRYGQA